jgi:arylsulfatase A-like enzyme
MNVLLMLDPRYRDRNDPALTTYAGTLPGFIQLVPGSEGADAWLRHLSGRGYDLTAETVYEPAVDSGATGRGPTFAPARYSAADSDTAFDIDEAIRYLAHQKAPWFLHLSLLRPHPPFVAPAPYHAMYDPARVPGFRGAASPEEEAPLHPYVAYMRRHFYERDGHDPARHPAEEPAMRQLRATYYGLMTEVDDQLGRLVAFLQRTGRYADTLIVFTTDHGEQLWDHWVLGKEFFFDQSFHIPLIVRAPGLESGRGRVVDAFTESIDVMPTILELLGADPPLQCDGASLRPFLAGAAPARWRQVVHWELDFRDVVNAGPERELGIALDECSLAVVRDSRHKYVHFTALPSLLFDIGRDPDERVDLAGAPEHTGDVARLAQTMLSWRLAKADRTLAGIKLTGGGPVERAREQRFVPTSPGASRYVPTLPPSVR